MVFWISAVILFALLLWFMIEKSRRQYHPVTGGVDVAVTLPHQYEFELYSNSFSHCSRKIRIALDELGISYKCHYIDLIETGWYQTISPAYLKINPAGLVPTLVHNGHPVYESDDILVYAQKNASGDAASLVPTDETQKAEMNRWLSFGAIESTDPMVAMESKAGSCIPGLTLPLFVTAIAYIPIQNILVGFLFHSDKKRPAFFFASKLFGFRRMMSHRRVLAIVLASRDHMARHLDFLNVALQQSDGPWILGDFYSLADVSISCLLLRLEETGWLAYFAKNYDIAEIQAYYKTLQSRPSWKKAITDHAHFIIEKAKLDLADITEKNLEVRQLLHSG
jgi:glutathione S-transferase